MIFSAAKFVFLNKKHYLCGKFGDFTPKNIT